MTEAPAASTRVPSRVLPLQDFPDRLPAVLVKELRQGLRARMFVIPFVLLHSLLMGSALSGIEGTGMFWACVLLMLGALLPARNVASLSEERDARTLDTLLLTRLTPWRIVMGKWSATFALVLLTAVSIVPYLFMRYLHGGSSFIREGAILAGLVFLSGAVTGVFTGLSIIPSALLRNVAAVLILLVSWTAGRQWLLPIGFLDEAGAFAQTGVMGIAASWAAVFSLSQAAAVLSSPAHRSALPRRLATATASVLMLAYGGLFPAARSTGVSLLGGILVYASLLEMGGPVARDGPDYRLRSSGLRGAAARLLSHPGWPSGVLFSLLVWTGVAGVAVAFGASLKDVSAAAGIPFFAHCLALPFVLRGHFGFKVPLLCFLAVQFTVSLARQLGAGAMAASAAAFLPVLPAGGYRPEMTLVWMGIALLAAVPQFVSLGLRNSRE